MRLIPPVWYAGATTGRQRGENMTTSLRYRVRVEGRLGERWRHWFEDMEVSVAAEAGTEVTSLAGPVADQAALLGLLQQLYTLGLPLLSVQREEGSERDAQPGRAMTRL
jgi:hypothetical protein